LAERVAQQLGHADTQMVNKVYMRFQPSLAEMAKMFDRVELLNSQGGAS
jgi:integrase